MLVLNRMDGSVGLPLIFYREIPACRLNDVNPLRKNCKMAGTKKARLTRAIDREGHVWGYAHAYCCRGFPLDVSNRRCTGIRISVAAGQQLVVGARSSPDTQETRVRFPPYTNAIIFCIFLRFSGGSESTIKIVGQDISIYKKKRILQSSKSSVHGRTVKSTL